VISSDGLTRDQFMPLWRDAMWQTTSLADRTRLVLELGRLDVRESQGSAAPRMVAYVAGLDTPFVLLQLESAPTVDEIQVRNAFSMRLAEMGASEVYVLMTVQGGRFGGVQNYLLSAWGESVDGSAACWVMPFRWANRGLQEAPPLPPPNPRETEIGKRLAGLLKPRH